MSQLKEKKLEYEFDLKNSFNNIRMLENQIAGKVDSWAIRWHASAFLKNKFTLYPGYSLVKNIGLGADATHTKGEDVFDVKLSDYPVTVKKIPVVQDESSRNAIITFFRQRKYKIVEKFLMNIKKIFRK